jgi:hypothetical protein
VVGLEVEARFENGAHASAMELLRCCWGNMISHNAETFWEMVDGRDGSFVTRVRVADTGNPESDTWDSYCHGWSAGVAFMLQGYVLGVIPVEPGFRRLRIAPRLGDLTHARGTVPTPLGDVTVSAEQRDGRMVAELDIPAGAEAVVTLGGKETLVGAGFHRLEGGCDG